MLFMIVERFKDRDPQPIYKRFAEQGRMNLEGLIYHASWIEGNFDRCFQLMECEDLSVLQKWILEWRDLVEFEIVPVVESKQMVELMKKSL